LADEAAGAVTEPRRFHENKDERQQALSQRVAAARQALAKPCGCVVLSQNDADRIALALQLVRHDDSRLEEKRREALALLRERSAE
jgi:hypothetical protein